jgi:hypothetical protein
MLEAAAGSIRCNGMGKRRMGGQMHGKILLALLASVTGAISAAAQSRQFTDPAAYCKAIGTIDEPDARYAGTGVPDWVLKPYFTAQDIAAARAQGRQPVYGVSWRCVKGDVLVCQNAQTPSCLKPDTDRTPSAAMQKFCEDGQGSSPVVPRVVTGTARMLAYEWGCQGKVPVIVKETPLDAEGFVAADWKHVKAN